MKNKYVTKCLCITLMSAMILAGSPASVAASDILISENASAGENLSGQPIQPSETPQLETPETEVPESTPAPEEPAPEISPTPSPEEPTPTPGEPTPEVSPTPTPGEPTPEVSPTPTPGEPTPEVSPTPGPVLTEKAQEVINKIQELSGIELTLEHKDQIRVIREAYNALSEEEKLAVSNYNDLVEMEKKISALQVEDLLDDENGSKDDLTDGNGGLLQISLLYRKENLYIIQIWFPIFMQVRSFIWTV